MARTIWRSVLGFCLPCLPCLLVGFLAGTASAQPPPPNPGIPRGPSMTAPYPPPPAQRPGTVTGAPATGGNSTSGSSGVLRVMIPDSNAAPAASPSGTAAPAPSGQPDFRSPPPPAPAVGTSTAGNPAYQNDPTIPNAEIRRILEGTGRDNTAPAAPPVPTMRVRARVFVSGQPPVAVLEINGRQMTVREGSDIYVWGGDSSTGMQLRVARMTTSEIRLEVVNKDQYFTLD
jgi:hypothetical protein